jgi:serine/threonine-protein kinase
MLWRDQVHISDHFASVLKKMLEVSVRHRYQNAAEVLRALDLEPYLDSLAQSMVTKPNRPSHSHSNYGMASGESVDLGDPSSPSSPSARMAAAIRARQAKSALGDSTGMSTGMRRRPVAAKTTPATVEPTRGSNSGGAPHITPKLGADELLLAYDKGKRDFTYHDLSLLNLQKVTLSGANFHQSQLHRINFQGANLFSTDFGRASLSQAVLKNANLARAYLSHADLQGADLRGADLSYAYLSNANLRGANLCGANLTGAKVTDEQLAMARTNWATVHPSGKRGLW